MVASAKPPDRSLTPKQELFARLVAEGKGLSEAYRIAYNTKGTPGAIKSDAYRTIILPHVEAKIAELKAKADERMFLTRSRKRHILYEIAETKRNKATDRIKAIEVDNRMSGDDAAIKIEGDITLLSALGQLKQVEPVIELETRVTPEPQRLAVVTDKAMETTPDERKAIAYIMAEPEKPEPAAPSVPFDSSPFADSPLVFAPPVQQSPANAKRTRSYYE